MAWIKFQRLRINLDLIFEYQRSDVKEIKLYVLKNGKPEEYKTLTFGDEENTEEALRQIDEAADKPKNISGVKS